MVRGCSRKTISENTICALQFRSNAGPGDCSSTVAQLVATSSISAATRPNASTTSSRLRFMSPSVGKIVWSRCAVLHTRRADRRCRMEADATATARPAALARGSSDRRESADVQRGAGRGGRRGRSGGAWTLSSPTGWSRAPLGRTIRDLRRSCAPGYCARPVLLRGRIETGDREGGRRVWSTDSEPDGAQIYTGAPTLDELAAAIKGIRFAVERRTDVLPPGNAPRKPARGADRNRTGVHGFAGRCVATPPRRRAATS